MFCRFRWFARQYGFLQWSYRRDHLFSWDRMLEYCGDWRHLRSLTAKMAMDYGNCYIVNGAGHLSIQMQAKQACLPRTCAIEYQNHTTRLRAQGLINMLLFAVCHTKEDSAMDSKRGPRFVPTWNTTGNRGSLPLQSREIRKW